MPPKRERRVRRPPKKSASPNAAEPTSGPSRRRPPGRQPTHEPRFIVSEELYHHTPKLKDSEKKAEKEEEIPFVNYCKWAAKKWPKYVQPME
ncbi:MAG: hypothetical protein GOV15_03545, partial [Candidatus Diapherotrites archaeon]|nr:hypothetical protein [Candidatus Diapherotrites archaeon]